MRGGRQRCDDLYRCLDGLVGRIRSAYHLACRSQVLLLLSFLPDRGDGVRREAAVSLTPRLLCLVLAL